MRWFINYIRSCFCRHDFIKVKQNEYTDGTTTTFMCSKCGWIRKVNTY